MAELKHLVINNTPYLVEEVVWDWHLALCRENDQLKEQIKEMEKSRDSWREAAEETLKLIENFELEKKV